MACGCGGEQHVHKDETINYNISRTNYGFKDYGETLEKVRSIDDDNFLNHLESLAPSKFNIPKITLKQVYQKSVTTNSCFGKIVFFKGC